MSRVLEKLSMTVSASSDCFHGGVDFSEVFIPPFQKCLFPLFLKKLWKICMSGFHQKNPSSRIYILRHLLQGIGLCDCGDCLCGSKIHRADSQEGWAGTLRHELELLSTGRISSSGKLKFCP